MKAVKTEKVYVCSVHALENNVSMVGTISELKEKLGALSKARNEYWLAESHNFDLSSARESEMAYRARLAFDESWDESPAYHPQNENEYAYEKWFCSLPFIVHLAEKK